MFKSIAEVKAANKALGHNWFEPATMRFFGTVIETPLIGGRHFITSDKMEPGDEKRYAVRQVNENGSVETVGNIRDFASVEGAQAYVKTLLRG